MKYLVDTNVFLWVLEGSEKLRAEARELISAERSELCFSAGSAWEIGLKYSIGRLPLPSVPAKFVPEALQKWGMPVLNITHIHALAVGELPWHHKDPFDRLLVAQASIERLAILTADRMFERYDVETVWCGR